MENNTNLIDSKGVPQIFNEIKGVYPNESLVKFYYINSLDNNEMTIKVKLMKNNSLNNQQIDIIFFISVDCYFPESSPILKCLTNFVKPTLFDGRNLLFSVINHNWTKETKIIDIIIKLPEFISRVTDNCNNKILVYYGEYQIDKVFDLNEIIQNNEIHFYKIKQRHRKNKSIISKERYIILTDIYFLLFDPISDSKNLGRLLFWGDIRQITSDKTSELPHDYLVLEWKNEEDKIVVNFEVTFNEKKCILEFLKNVSYKKEMLKENFNIFQDDINKPNSEEEQNLSLEKVELLIKYKEELLEKKYSIHLVKDLMNLYQKIIEILSAGNESSFTVYLEKLHKMLQIKHAENMYDIDPTKNSPSSFKYSYNASSSLNESSGIDNYQIK